MTKGTAGVSENPYLVPFSDKDPTKDAAGAVTLMLPKVIRKIGEVKGVKVDYYMPAVEGSDQCSSADAIPLVGKMGDDKTEGGSTKKEGATVTLKVAIPIPPTVM